MGKCVLSLSLSLSLSLDERGRCSGRADFLIRKVVKKPFPSKYGEKNSLSFRSHLCKTIIILLLLFVVVFKARSSSSSVSRSRRRRKVSAAMANKIEWDTLFMPRALLRRGDTYARIYFALILSLFLSHLHEHWHTHPCPHSHTCTLAHSLRVSLSLTLTYRMFTYKVRKEKDI